MNDEKADLQAIESLAGGTADEAAAAVGRLLAVTQATYERRAQLEQALQSRVAIEQAKGVVAERYGLGVDEAFRLIRQAARSNRIKLHDLVQRIRPGAPAPAELDAVLRRPQERAGRLAEARSRNEPCQVGDPVAERIKKNNALFREANERIRATADEHSVDMERIPFLCECARPDCMQILRLTPSEYGGVRADPKNYMTAVGHEKDEEPVGHVVARKDGYMIVEK